MEYELGTGILAWTAEERKSDRYGLIYLLPQHTSKNQKYDGLNKKVIKELIGEEGRLIVRIIETRNSSHIGDLFRNIYPKTPKVGEEIILGEGKLFTEPIRDLEKVTLSVGLKPNDNRCHDWLNPHSLYNAHDQTVKLLFINKFTSFSA